MSFSLNNSVLNKKCVVVDVNDLSSIKRRFNDIGIIPGISIMRVLDGPFGGISAYSVLGSLIAIRDVDAKDVIVRYE